MEAAYRDVAGLPMLQARTVKRVAYKRAADVYELSEADITGCGFVGIADNRDASYTSFVLAAAIGAVDFFNGECDSVWGKSCPEGELVGDYYVIGSASTCNLAFHDRCEWSNSYRTALGFFFTLANHYGVAREATDLLGYVAIAYMTREVVNIPVAMCTTKIDIIPSVLQSDDLSQFGFLDDARSLLHATGWASLKLQHALGDLVCAHSDGTLSAAMSGDERKAAIHQASASIKDSISKVAITSSVGTAGIALSEYRLLNNLSIGELDGYITSYYENVILNLVLFENNMPDISILRTGVFVDDMSLENARNVGGCYGLYVLACILNTHLDRVTRADLRPWHLRQALQVLAVNSSWVGKLVTTSIKGSFEVWLDDEVVDFGEKERADFEVKADLEPPVVRKTKSKGSKLKRVTKARTGPKSSAPVFGGRQDSKSRLGGSGMVGRKNTPRKKGKKKNHRRESSRKHKRKKKLPGSRARKDDIQMLSESESEEAEPPIEFMFEANFDSSVRDLNHTGEATALLVNQVAANMAGADLAGGALTVMESSPLDKAGMEVLGEHMMTSRTLNENLVAVVETCNNVTFDPSLHDSSDGDEKHGLEGLEFTVDSDKVNVMDVLCVTILHRPAVASRRLDAVVRWLNEGGHQYSGDELLSRMNIPEDMRAWLLSSGGKRVKRGATSRAYEVDGFLRELFKGKSPGFVLGCIKYGTTMLKKPVAEVLSQMTGDIT
jgi:hypothetical protein